MWAFCGDQSRFDAHKREKALKATNEWYQAHYPGDRYLEWLLKLRFGTKGYSYFGRKYKQRESCVCSGDYDTSLGNTWTIDALFHDLDLEFIVGEGDDCLFIGTPNQVTRAAEEARLVAEEHGFSFDGFIAVDPAEAEYCSAKVGAHDLIRVYPKPLHTEGWSVHTYPDQFKAAVSKQMAMSALYRYQGQAVYGQFALWLWEKAQHLRVRKTGMWHEGAWGVHPCGDLQAVITKCGIVTDEARVEFAIATGVSPHEQRLLEAAYRARPLAHNAEELQLWEALKGR